MWRRNGLLVVLLLVLNTMFVRAQDSVILFMSDMDGNREIYTMNSDRSNVRRLTNDPAEDIEPSWSPDHSQITFASNREGDNFAVYIMNADGSGVRRLTTDTMGSFNSSPVWSPDGRVIAFVSNANNINQIYLINTDGTNFRRLTQTNDEAIDPAWSPNARQLSYASNENGYFEIFVMNLDGTGVKQLSHEPDADSDSPAWSPDGTEIVFAANGGSGDILIVNVGTGETRVLTGDENATASSPSWSQDGKSIVYILRARKERSSIWLIGADGNGLKRLTDGNNEGNFPSWAAPVLVGPPPPPPVAPCPGAPSPRMIIGNEGTVTPGMNNNLRARATRNSNAIDDIYPGDRFTVLDGPICADGYYWWKVDFRGRIGWTAEGRKSDYWLEPIGVPPQAATTSNQSNSTDQGIPIDCFAEAIRNKTQSRVRPSTSAASAGIINPGTVYKVVAQSYRTNDPNGRLWWQLENGAWVREDAVKETGNYCAVPAITP